MIPQTITIPDWAIRAAHKAYETPIRDDASLVSLVPGYVSDDVFLCIAKAIHDAVMAERPKLQPIETAPDLERVMVAGWNPPSGSVAGYWWYEEDCVDDGKAIDKPYATHWFPIVKPVFPAAPKAEEA